MSNKTITEIAENNILKMDVVTVLNYIEHTFTLLTNQPSTLSKSMRIMSSIYLFGRMPTKKISEKTFMLPADVASKSSQIRKEGRITKSGIYFDLTEESRAKVIELEKEVQKNAKAMDKKQLSLLYNSYIMMISPFVELEEKPSIFYLLILAVSVHEHLCGKLLNKRNTYGRISVLYYTEVFGVMDYVKLSYLLPKSIQNIQILSRRLRLAGYINIDIVKARQKRPDITVTEKGREFLVKTIAQSNINVAVLMNEVGPDMQKPFLTGINNLKTIAVKKINKSGIDREFS